MDYRKQYFSSYIFQVNCLLLEHLLFEPSGTSLYFKASESNVDVVCEQPRSERNNFQFIESLQSMALQFIKDYRNNLNLNLKMHSYHIYLNSIIMVTSGTKWLDVGDAYVYG